MTWKFISRLLIVPVALCLSGFTVEDAGRWELENAFKGSRPAWPLRGFRNLPRVWAKQAERSQPGNLAERNRLLGLRYGTPEFNEELAKRYGLHYDPNFPNDGLPYALTRTQANFVTERNPAPGSGEAGITFNCRGCHSGVFFGTHSEGRVFTEGVSNVFMDIDRLDGDVMAAAGFGTGNLFARNLPRNSMNNAADYFGRLLTYVRRPYPRFDFLSAYQSFYGRFRLPEHKHLERDVQAYLKTQYWVNVGTKYRAAENRGLYVDGGFYDNPSTIMYGVLFTVDPSGNDFLAADQGFLQRGLPYLTTLKAPAYPGLAHVDREATQRGFSLYQQTCARCHGTYQASGDGFVLTSYPGKIIPAEKVGTDPLRAHEHGFGDVMDGNSWVPKGRLLVTNGYMAPPLHGVWARAPYLHNASVPNLRQLMKPSTRMKRYTIQPLPLIVENYDEKNMGWKVAELKNAGEIAALKKKDAYARIYDPEAYPKGLANTGHGYGALLTDAQVDDLIAFLLHL